MNKDENELQHQSVSEKFAVIVNMLNDAAFNGAADITPIDKREFNLYDGSNQIIKFQYSTGSLTITWKYKYYQKEIVHERNFTESRNLSIFEQEKIANAMMIEMKQIVEKHKKDVLGM
ncbi:hypothetical protein [Dyadobacter chenhuakuii]|uniref:Uncharacterized protein n=1 Tax=Dyadobacter chenhuakuii TaxID=2909339 RepID=A0A9X1TUT8_9BACT|nr:hypothetical protein [Dyadobacter chenhuakuii]MCF2501684.1 hypothetical protein [Dyadobacter chenhuakuii]